MNPLVILGKKDHVLRRAIYDIFANWETIYSVQCSLLKALEERVQVWYV